LLKLHPELPFEILIEAALGVTALVNGNLRIKTVTTKAK
jgi:hypothetical protein